jgi:hypothetical protein
MTNYEDLKDLFQLLKLVQEWFDTSGWGMIKVMHIVLLEAIKTTFVVAPFIVVS